MRALFRTFLAVKSLIVGLAVLGLWARSYFVGDQFRRGDDAQYIQLGSARGSVIVTFGHDGTKTRFGGSWDYVASKEPRQMLADASVGSENVWNRLGFGFRREMTYAPVRGMRVILAAPHWLVFLLAIPSAVKWFIRRRRREEEDAVGVFHECPRCGQMFARVPHTCPICGQPLAAPEFR